MKELILTILLVVFFLIPISKAQGVSIQLPVSELAINVGETKSINVTVKNLQDKKDLFSLLIWPPLTTDISTLIQARVELEPGAEAKIPLTFSVAECAIERVLLFEITTASLTNLAVKDSKPFILKVRGEGLTCITGIETNKVIFNPGEEVKIIVSLSNYAGEEGEFVLEVMVKKDKEIEKSFTDTIFLKGRDSKKLQYEYFLDEHALAGSYDIDVLLKKEDKVVSSRTTKFGVRVVENLNYTHSTKNFIILQTGSIKIKNLGNSRSSPTIHNLVIPAFMKIFFYSPTELLGESVSDSQVIYSWKVPSLEPLEEYEIKYEFRFWPIWVGVSLAIVLLVFIYIQFYSIKIVKRTKPVGILSVGSKIPISISIVNNSSSELKDILVKDLVPPIASVVEKFETLKPVKRRTTAGTELNWRIPSLKPGEEVILSYRIKPIVDIIGTLKLPKAQVRFISKNKEKKVLVSKPIVISPIR